VTPAFLHSPEAQGLRAMLRRTSWEGYAAAAEAIATAELAAETKTLRVPTLVLVGEHDASTPLSSAEALRDAIPGARLHVIPRAAHIPTIERPEAVTEAMRHFLTEHQENIGQETAEVRT
jgi:3-oxoadipate enol-lactonase/4-carboxymuconolactone decarboxylase